MTILISREVPLFNFQRLDLLCLQIGHPFEKIGPFEFLKRFRYTISSVSIYYVPELDIREDRTISITREVPLFNFERLDILSP